MKKLTALLFLSLLIFVPHCAIAAGSWTLISAQTYNVAPQTTVTNPNSTTTNGTVYRVAALQWVGDSSSGSVPTITTDSRTFVQTGGDTLTQFFNGYYMYAVVAQPSTTTAPTNGYGVTITNSASLDILGGSMSSVSSSVAQYFTPTTGLVTGTLTIKVTGNSVASGSAILYLYAANTSPGSGGGGTWGSITGTLSNQTDLNTALSGKQATNSVMANPIVTASPSSTGTVTVNCATTALEIITPTTASQADTLAFSNAPAAGSVVYVRVEIVAPASGTQTIVWPISNFNWVGGVSGQLTALTANKHYEYILEVENGVINAQIISEGLF